MNANVKHALTNPANWVTLATAIGSGLAALMDNEAFRDNAKLYGGAVTLSLWFQLVAQGLRDIKKPPATDDTTRQLPPPNSGRGA